MPSLLAFVFLLLLPPLTAAASEPKPSRFVGCWQSMDGTVVIEQTFRADGRFSGSTSTRGKVIWSFGGIWSLTGRQLSYVYERSSLPQIPAGTTDQDRVLRLSRNGFTLQGSDGSLQRYKRVP